MAPPGRELLLTGAGLAIMVGASIAFGIGAVAGIRAATGVPWAAVLTVIVLVGTMTGTLAFLIARWGFHSRRRRPDALPNPAGLLDGAGRNVTILVPSYREEEHVIWQTLVSAALQTYPGVDVVLLIDDPPRPKTIAEQWGLDRARALPARLDEWLAAPSRRAVDAERAFEHRYESSDRSGGGLAIALASALDDVSAWFTQQAAAQPHGDHTDQLFVAQILQRPARQLAAEAADLRRRVAQGRTIGVVELCAAHRRLVDRCSARITSFERKGFANLSHAPNKAMNLNSYVGLVGGRWRVAIADGERRLVPAGSGPADLVVPRHPFIVTLDADSLVVDDYVATLVEHAERPGNADIAVLQTPYSSIPGASSVLERTAGATTDIQYLIHQGFAHFGAGFWVGANAVIRSSALEDIRRVVVERGTEMAVFISDRTVIEDTESSLELAARGWRIHNHPQRLSYSATPADFGSLIIQRRRWANGGLILVHKLLAVAQRQVSPVGLFLRGHYLVSIALSNIALLLLLFGGVSTTVDSVFLPIAAAPYFILYSRDLAQAGYRRAEVVRVYALNLLLVPANLAGVLRSLQQVIRQRPTPFARTPKIAGRTAAPPLHHLCALVMVAGAGVTAAMALSTGRVAAGCVAAINGGLLVYGLSVFVGWREVSQGVVTLIPRQRAVLPPQAA